MTPRYRHRIALLALAGALLWGSARPACASALAASEYDIKAAYLYNFVKFVQWPPAALPVDDKPFCIGVLGDDPFQGRLESLLNGKLAQGHPVAVQHFKNQSEADHCQIVFVGVSDHDRREAVLTQLATSSVLTVGDSAKFPVDGGVVGFDVVQDRVRFDINLKAAETAHLTLSSDLLKVAHTVHGAPAQPNP